MRSFMLEKMGQMKEIIHCYGIITSNARDIEVEESSLRSIGVVVSYKLCSSRFPKDNFYD